MPIARKHAAASKGATGPKPRLSASKLAKRPETMATRPLPRNMALENVNDSHCGSKALCEKQKTTGFLVNTGDHQVEGFSVDHASIIYHDQT